MPTKIFITGKGSFIGQHIITNLKNFSFEEIDLLKTKVQDVDFSPSELVIHLAAIVHQKKTTAEEIYFKVNTELAYKTALEAKKQGVGHFIFFSTIKVYGDGGYEDIVFTESSNCKPLDAYGKSKLEAEMKILGLADEDFTVSVIRPSMVYGKGVKANMYLLSNLVKKMPIIPLGNIPNKRSMVSIDNLMLTLDAVIRKQESGVYLACDRSSISTSDLVEKLIQLINPRKKLIPLPKWIQKILKVLFPFKMRRIIGNFNVDATETHQKLGITEKLEDVKSGLQKML